MVTLSTEDVATDSGDDWLGRKSFAQFTHEIDTKKDRQKLRQKDKQKDR